MLELAQNNGVLSFCSDFCPCCLLFKDAWLPLNNFRSILGRVWKVRSERRSWPWSLFNCSSIDVLLFLVEFVCVCGRVSLISKQGGWWSCQKSWLKKGQSCYVTSKSSSSSGVICKHFWTFGGNKSLQIVYQVGPGRNALMRLAIYFISFSLLALITPFGQCVSSFLNVVRIMLIELTVPLKSFITVYKFRNGGSST